MPTKKLTIRGVFVATVLGSALAGCGTSHLDGAKAESTIRTLVTSKIGVPVKRVTCPRNVKLQKGQVTTCQLLLTSGETEPFTVTQTDANGTVHIQPADELAGGVEKTIVDRLGQQGVTATAVCPQQVVIGIGATFTCTATDTKGTKVRITATITDALGAYRLKVT